MSSEAGTQVCGTANSMPGVVVHDGGWSLVEEAAAGGSRSRAALEQLCTGFWRPMYSLVRRRGFDAEDARDLTQEFFTRMIEKDYLRDANRALGPLHSFLAGCLKHFLANEWDRRIAQKRGGNTVFVSLDQPVADGRTHQPSHRHTPETTYETKWVTALLGRALARLRQEYEARDKAATFEGIKPFLTGDQVRGGYEGLAAALRVTENAAKVAVHRARRRYGQLLRQEVLDIVKDTGRVEGELRFMLSVLERR